MIHTKEQRSKALVTGVPWKDADSSAMDKERVPSRLNMLLKLHHGVLMECVLASLGKLVLGRKKTNQKTALTAPRGRSRRVAWSKPILAIHAQICKQGAPLLNYWILLKGTVGTLRYQVPGRMILHVLGTATGAIERDRMALFDCLPVPVV